MHSTSIKLICVSGAVGAGVCAAAAPFNVCILLRAACMVHNWGIPFITGALNFAPQTDTSEAVCTYCSLWFHGIITYVSGRGAIIRLCSLIDIFLSFMLQGSLSLRSAENACLHTAKHEPDAAGTWHPELDMLCMCSDILDLFPIK